MKTIIVIPAYTHIDDRLLSVLLASRIPYVPRYRISDLPRCRSQLLSHALRQDGERVILIDSDIIPTLEQLRHLAETPDVTPTQAVSGTYRLRDGRLSGGEGMPVGLGFCAISVWSLARAAAQLPIIRDAREPWYPFCVPLVLESHEGNRYLADDGSLWWRLEQSDTSLLVKPELHVTHATLQEQR